MSAVGDGGRASRARHDRARAGDGGVPATAGGGPGPVLGSGAEAAPHAGEDGRGGVLDTSTANAARMYDYWTGGKDHFAADRAAGDQVARLAPWVVQGARTNRRFVRRATTFLARAGIRQFLDLGAGLPGRDPVHEVAARAQPGARVAYVDVDPLVLAYARALLQDPDTVVVAGDVRDPQAILNDSAVRTHLDFDQPIAVLITAVLHFLPDEQDPAGVVANVRDTLVPGSYIALSHGADLPDQEARRRRAAASQEAARLYQQLVATPAVLRTRDQICAMFAGLELVEPGLVGAHEWRPPRGRPDSPVSILAGVGKVP